MSGQSRRRLVNINPASDPRFVFAGDVSVILSKLCVVMLYFTTLQVGMIRRTLPLKALKLVIQPIEA